MNIIEGMTTIIMNKDVMDKKRREREMNIILVSFLIKILSIAIVSYFLWPKVVPKIFPTVQENPGFVNLFGLSVIVNLLR